ncbi:MAG: hypothetical protein ACRDV4_04720 [Acidimicrobiales bacterium]
MISAIIVRVARSRGPMDEPEAADEVAEHVGFDRRAFVKRVVIGSAFAVPVITSFSMSGVNSAFAGPLVHSNKTG